MFCKKCGSALNDGAQFCPHCGQDQTVVYDQTTAVEGTVVEENTAEKDALAGSAFKFGLMGLIFSCTGFLSLIGIILSAVGLGKAGKFSRIYKSLQGRAIAGKILSIIGLVEGILVTVILFFYFIFVILLVMSEMGAY